MEGHDGGGMRNEEMGDEKDHEIYGSESWVGQVGKNKKKIALLPTVFHPVLGEKLATIHAGPTASSALLKLSFLIFLPNQTMGTRPFPS